MPTGSSIPPGTRPTRLAWLCGLPKSEIASGTFSRGGFAPFALLVVCGPVAESSILRVFRHIEENIATAFVSEPSRDEFLHKLDDFPHRIGCSRHPVDLVDSQRLKVGKIVRCHLRRELKHRDPFFARFHDQFVIDVGDIDHPGHIVSAVDQIPFDGVKNHGSNHMANVGFGIYRRPT